jgi:DNA-binding transcriptional LysR family regulator
MMELRLVRAFVAVADELHFGRAAARLHIAQPALSQQIKQLEAARGTALFARTSRRVELTGPGAAFLPQARKLLDDAELAAERVRRAASGQAGWLTLGFVDSAAYSMLPPLLRRLREELPQVHVELRELATEPQLEALHDEIDLGIVRAVDAGVTAAGLAVDPLLREPLVAALPGGHPLAGRRLIDLADLSGDAFVLFPRDRVPLVHDHLVHVCRVSGFSPQVGQHALQYPTMLALVSAGYGVALVPASLRVLRHWDLAYARLRDRHATTQVALAWREGLGDPVVDRVRRLAHAVVAASQGS